MSNNLERGAAAVKSSVVMFPQQPALQLIYDTAPIGLAFLSPDCQPDLAMNSYPGPYGQVLNNLFLNAVTHAFPDDKGGIIDIRVLASGNDHVEIGFSDNGCGMSSSVRRQAFNPFFHAPRSRQHRPRPAHRPQHRHQLPGRAAHARQQARRGNENPDHPAA